MSSKDKDWFARAYPACLEGLTRYVHRFIRSWSVAETLAQEAFMDVYASESFEANPSPRRDLLQVAKKLALDTTKINGVRHAVSSLETRGAVEGDKMQLSDHDILCTALAHLTPRGGKILVLRSMHQYSCQELLRMLGISKRVLHRELALGVKAVHAARQAVNLGQWTC